MLDAGHLSCFELGMSWAPLMLRVGHLELMLRVGHLSCFELGTFDASSWAPLMLRVGHLFDASSWAPLMLVLGTSHASSWA